MSWKCKFIDLCELDSHKYLAATAISQNAYKCAYATGMSIIGKLKNIFAHWGIPEKLVTDNGLQFTDTNFMKKYSSLPITISSHYP